MSEVFVKRGQFVFGRKTAAKELKMVERTVHKRMLKLKTTQNCDIQSDTHCSIITILNYDAYQSTPRDEGTGKVTGKGQASDTNKNDKNEKKLLGRSRKETDPRVKEFFDSWGERYQEETESPYVFTYAKEGDLVKKLLKVHSLETLDAMARAFFRDEEAKRRGFDIGTFRWMINCLGSRQAMDPLEQAKREQRERAQD